MNRNLSCVGALSLFAAAAAMGVPAATPLYTFCEVEDNDLCVDSQVLDASIAAMYSDSEDGRDCFFVTGKLQKDCVWDFQPKCAIRAVGKPVQCYDSNRQPVPGQFYEPLLATSDSQGRILNLAPGAGDRTIRLAIATTVDALDGTVNGLNQNSPHDETGEVTIKLVYDGIDDGPFRGDEPDDSYVFRFGGPESALGSIDLRGGGRSLVPNHGHSDAARVAFVIPPGVSTVDVYCCNDTGTQEACYDVDFYTVTNLIPNRSYCLTVVGGLDEFCEKPHLALGWFDKQWQLLQCQTVEANADGMQAFPSDLCILSDGEGVVRFGVSGGNEVPIGILSRADCNFNGLSDFFENEYFFLRFLLDIRGLVDDDYRPGASTKDASADAVTRYPRAIWDSEEYGSYFANVYRIAPEVEYGHGVCAEYCIKVRLAEHVDPSERPTWAPPVMGAHMADLNTDDVVNASDLAMLLSFWGAVPVQ